ncbi:MAG TPA: DUF1573 domain-containing protein [Sediminibacterium sp.]
MKRIIVLCSFFLLVQQLAAQTQVTVATDIDKLLSFTNADYDMGKIPSGKPLEYNVVIKNISKDTVVLKEVTAGCGCTTPKYRANEKIAPGKSTFITLGFNGGASGPFSKTAVISFTNGLNKPVQFKGVAVADSTAAKPVNMN